MVQMCVERGWLYQPILALVADEHFLGSPRKVAYTKVDEGLVLVGVVLCQELGLVALVGEESLEERDQVERLEPNEFGVGYAGVPGNCVWVEAD